jgi:hypothetical protein
MRIAQGWQFLGLASDLRMMMDGVQAVLGPIRKEAGERAANY